MQQAFRHQHSSRNQSASAHTVDDPNKYVVELSFIFEGMWVGWLVTWYTYAHTTTTSGDVVHCILVVAVCLLVIGRLAVRCAATNDGRTTLSTYLLTLHVVFINVG